MSRSRLLLAVAGFGFISSQAVFADSVIGPGQTTITAQDIAFNLISVDLDNTESLSAGTYDISNWNYQFSDLGGTPQGSVTPILLMFNGSNYIPVAVGSAASYSGTTGFVTASFGGPESFTLNGTTTIYAGLYWSDPGGTPNVSRMPIGFSSSSGSSLVLYSDPPGDGGANAPVVGAAISASGPGATRGTFTRAYNFDVVTPVATPEPSSYLLLGAGLIGLAILSRKVVRANVRTSPTLPSNTGVRLEL